VTKKANVGTVIECEVETGVTNGEPLTFLLSPTLAADVGESGEAVGIIGAIIDRPAERISGYTGDAAQAIWISRLFTLD
jgi:hypothetical protein